ncbi:MAG: amino acid permease [Parachlamydiales bacterium]|nr:amino acid permease [Parachlamydiales bacterium]
MTKVMNRFTLIWVASAFGISIRNLPIFAKTGMNMIFFAVVAVIIFYIPIALVSAELATGWPKMGGVVIWVKEAFGKKWGFVAIWFQWIYMNIAVIAMLYFISGTFAYVFAPGLLENKVYLISMTLFIIWLFTYFNLKGLKLSSKISMSFFLIGILLPAVLIIFLGFHYYLTSDNSFLVLSFKKDAILPNFSDFSSLVILVGFMRAFGGVEGSAVHANSVDNPKKNYPIAIGIVVLLCFSINVLGALCVSFVVKENDISLIGGVMQSFTFYLSRFNLVWVVPFLGFLVGIGQIGGFSTWIGGPVKGLLESAKEGELPEFFQKVNKNGAPKNLMIIQAIIISITSTLFLFTGTSVNMAFWISVALAMMIYFSMYVLMLLSCIYLRYKMPDVVRAFKIPFKNFGAWVVCVLGILAMIFGFIMALIPPSQLPQENKVGYILTLLGFIFVVYLIPFIIHKLKKPSWLKKL